MDDKVDDLGVIETRPPRLPGERYAPGTRTAPVPWPVLEEVVLDVVIVSTGSEAQIRDACEFLGGLFDRTPKLAGTAGRDAQRVRSEQRSMMEMRTITRHLAGTDSGRWDSGPYDAAVDFLSTGRRDGSYFCYGERVVLAKYKDQAHRYLTEGAPNVPRERLMKIIHRWDRKEVDRALACLPSDGTAVSFVSRQMPDRDRVRVRFDDLLAGRILRLTGSDPADRPSVLLAFNDLLDYLGVIAPRFGD